MCTHQPLVHVCDVVLVCSEATAQRCYCGAANCRGYLGVGKPSNRHQQQSSPRSSSACECVLCMCVCVCVCVCVWLGGGGGGGVLSVVPLKCNTIHAVHNVKMLRVGSIRMPAKSWFISFSCNILYCNVSPYLSNVSPWSNELLLLPEIVCEDHNIL